MKADEAAETVLPLVEETLRVEKRVVETGRVRVGLRTDIVEDVLRDTLRSRRVEIEHVAIGRTVTEIPRIRQENDVIIVPVVEEVLVVEKRLVLREEIHLRLIEGQEDVAHAATRRVQRATVERLPPDTISGTNSEEKKA